MKPEWVRPFFVIAAMYDFILGVVFLLAWRMFYERFHIEPPNHPAYIEFAAAVVTTFGIGFWFVARVIPLHYLYHLYNGFSFAVGTALYTFTRWTGIRLPGALPLESWRGSQTPAARQRVEARKAVGV